MFGSAAFVGRQSIKIRGLSQSDNPAPDAAPPITQTPIQLTPEQIQQLLSTPGAATGQIPAGSAGTPWQPPQNANTAVQELIRNGAIVEVEIEPPPSVAASLKAAGQTVPPPQKVRLMVDTGASITGIRDSVAASAGLVATSSVQVGGVAGSQTSAIYGAKVALPKYNINFDTVEIAGFQLPGQQDIDGLLGRDLLQKMDLLYNGPTGSFNLQSPPGEAGSTASLVSVIAAGVIAAAAFGSLFWLGTKTV